MTEKVTNFRREKKNNIKQKSKTERMKAVKAVKIYGSQYGILSYPL